MSRRLLLAATAVLSLGGCAVADHKYPLAWDPLLPAATADCRQFEGSFADRGEMAGAADAPSLTLGLFGQHSNWEGATRVDLRFPVAETLDISVWGKDKLLFQRRLTAQAGEFFCKAGRLTVRSKRWIAGDMMSGRQDMSIEFNDTPRHLVAQVEEKTYGVMFAVVPLVGTAKHWYRFPRLPGK